MSLWWITASVCRLSVCCLCCVRGYSSFKVLGTGDVAKVKQVCTGKAFCLSFLFAREVLQGHLEMMSMKEVFSKNRPRLQDVFIVQV